MLILFVGIVMLINNQVSGFNLIQDNFTGMGDFGWNNTFINNSLNGNYIGTYSDRLILVKTSASVANARSGVKSLQNISYNSFRKGVSFIWESNHTDLLLSTGGYNGLNNIVVVFILSNNSGWNDHNDIVDGIYVYIDVNDNSSRLYELNSGVQNLEDGDLVINTTDINLINITINESVINVRVNNTLTASSTHLLNFTKGNWTFGYNLFTSRGAGVGDKTLYIDYINITNINSVPTIVNITFNPLSVLETENVSIIFNTTDSDSDVVINNTYWFINNTMINYLGNLTTITSGNYSTNDSVIVMIRGFDGQEYGNYVNSSELIIGDIIVPDIISYFLTDNSIDTTGTLNVTANCTDDLSDIETFIFTILSPTTTFNRTFNIVGGEKSVNSSYKIFESQETATAGTYNITNLFCKDSSGNEQTNNTNLQFTVSAVQSTTVVPGVGGGVSVESKPKVNCSIKILPESLDFIAGINIKRLNIINDMNFSINPTFYVEDTEQIQILGFVNKTILPKEKLELSVLLNQFSVALLSKELNNSKDIGLSSITLQSVECKDIIIPISISSGQVSIINKDIFNKILKGNIIIGSLLIKFYIVAGLVLLLIGSGLSFAKKTSLGIRIFGTVILSFITNIFIFQAVVM